jgi:hypothetical protein
MQLRDYQIEISNRAAAILARHGLVYLAMEVRTGKTITALQTAINLNCSQILFVTKKKAISSIDKDAISMQMEGKMVITNFEQLYKIDPGFDLVIVDEAHSIGAFPVPSNRAKELKRICSNGCKVIFLSGTPTPESYSQFYHQLYITEYSPWNAYVNFYKWAKDYVQVKSLYVYNRELKDYSDADEDRIRQDIDEIFISFTQIESGFNQVVEDEVLPVPMPDVVKKSLFLLKRDRLINTKSGGVILADTAVKYMQKVHQICSGSVLDEDGNLHLISDFKAQFIKEHFSGKKIAVFYKFVGERRLITNVFPNFTESPETFNSSADLVFISQIQSGREGLDLSTADCLVMYNIDFSAVSYWQARARLQSKDRQDAAKVYWVISEGGIEIEIYKTVQRKKDFTLSHFRKSSLY